MPSNTILACTKRCWPPVNRTQLGWQRPTEIAQFIAVCSSAKPCEIGENLCSVPDPISRLQERLIYDSALIPSPTPQRRPVPGVHPYAAVERSSPAMPQTSEPPCWSLGDISLPAWTATLPL